MGRSATRSPLRGRSSWRAKCSSRRAASSATVPARAGSPCRLCSSSAVRCCRRAATPTARDRRSEAPGCWAVPPYSHDRPSAGHEQRADSGSNYWVAADHQATGWYHPAPDRSRAIPFATRTATTQCDLDGASQQLGRARLQRTQPMPDSYLPPEGDARPSFPSPSRHGVTVPRQAPGAASPAHAIAMCSRRRSSAPTESASLRGAAAVSSRMWAMSSAYCAQRRS